MSVAKLSDFQRARIERNRQKALLLRNARLLNRPYPDPNPKVKDSSNVSSGNISNQIDTGGGFLLDPDDEEETERLLRNIVEEPAPILEGDTLSCNECQKEFQESFLYKHFEEPVCDGCRDNEGKHSLITKTDAKQQYLLKDCDLDKREPPLMYILKRNPHHSRGGDMKLYLKLQVVQRSHLVWGDDDKLADAKEHRQEKRELQKQRKFDKKVKALRKAVRTSTWRKTPTKHEHEFPADGEEGCEVYNEEDDTWTKTCKTCGYRLTYEKM